MLQVPVDDDGEIVDINDQLQLEKFEIGDNADQTDLQQAPGVVVKQALAT